MKKTCLMILGVLLLITCVSAHAVVMSRYEISVYSEPTLESVKRCKVETNQEIELIGKANNAGWIRARKDNCEGWISYKWTKEITQETVEQLPKKHEQTKAINEEKRHARIKELEAAVKPIPASDCQRNFEIYEQLLKLDSENKKYIAKVKNYKACLDERNKTGFAFRKVKWGMSVNNVVKSEKRFSSSKLLQKSDKLLQYATTISGLKVLLMYGFENGKLNSSICEFLEKHSNKNLYVEDFYDIDKILIKKYGGTTASKKWSRTLYKDDPEYIGMAISAGHVEIINRWADKKSRIIHIIQGDNYKISHQIAYFSQAGSWSQNRSKRNSDLDEL